MAGSYRRFTKTTIDSKQTPYKVFTDRNYSRLECASICSMEIATCRGFDSVASASTRECHLYDNLWYEIDGNIRSIYRFDRKCPTGFFEKFTSCYKLIQNKKSFTDATDYCKENGWKLAEPKSKKLQVSLRIYMRMKYSNYQGWIGVYDGKTATSSRGPWVWISDMEPIQNSDWDSGEPNHDSERCVEMREDNSQWNDTSCNDKLLFICEI
ncbi:C-type lectin lectoxin-Phi1-like [Tubulanus polymorphus]|uniref:C-type lectin lectoxin-Phi1-like n=1 Tax=Tubulanus polymorphus TaxID=672921 RepID=UPI003DA43240